MAERRVRPGFVYWTVDAADCDVKDKDTLRVYRRKRTEWTDWLFGEDEHTISTQIHVMCWSYIVFRIVIESRRLAEHAGRPSSALNGVVGELIDQGFAAKQAIAVRRLTEPASKDAVRQVISLRRLVDDLKAHRRIITREVFVGFDGAPFEPEPGRERARAAAEERMRNSNGVACWAEPYATAGPEAWGHALRLHETFDKLAQIPPEKRSRHDVISDDTFKRLEKQLNEPSIEGVKALCDKYVAHAADPESRALSKHVISGLKFSDLDKAHEAIISTGELLATLFFQNSLGGPVPIAQFDQFDMLDALWSTDHDIASLNRCWHDLVCEREVWANNAAKLILS